MRLVGLAVEIPLQMLIPMEMCLITMLDDQSYGTAALQIPLIEYVSYIRMLTMMMMMRGGLMVTRKSMMMMVLLVRVIPALCIQVMQYVHDHCSQQGQGLHHFDHHSLV